MRSGTFVALLTAFFLTGITNAAVQYRINGGTITNVPSPPVIDLVVLGVPVDSQVTVHVFDSSDADGINDSTSQPIVVKGTWSTGGTLRFQVVHSSDADAFDQTAGGTVVSA